MMCRVPCARTLTGTVRLAEPPAPEQLKVYDAVALNGPTPSDPAVAFVPDQSPDAVHEFASVEDQVSVSDSPAAIDAGLDVNVTVGAGPICAGAGLPLSLPPPQAASSRLAIKPVNDRTAIW